MYSLLRRYAKISLIPSQQAEDQDVSNFQLELPNNRASCLKSKLEKNHFGKLFLLLVTMLGTSMLIGDGILTPCISVLWVVGRIKEATSAMTEGAEALFADVGHFTVRSIQRSMSTITYSAIMLVCIGQFSYLRLHNDDVFSAFYKSILGNMYWLMFVLAVLAAIIASQSAISGTFSVI